MEEIVLELGKIADALLGLAVILLGVLLAIIFTKK